MSRHFHARFTVRWADIDGLGHVLHSRYPEYATSARMLALTEAGLGWDWMTAEQVAPVLFREEVHYKAELRMGEQITVDVRRRPGDDRRKFSFVHRIVRDRDGELAATVEVDGAWMDLRTRRVTAAPDRLWEMLQELEEG